VDWQTVMCYCRHFMWTTSS